VVSPHDSRKTGASQRVGGGERAYAVHFHYNLALFVSGFTGKGVFMNAVLFVLAFCVGIFISVQAAVNSQLAHALHANSVVAAFISFSVGTVVLGIAAFARGGVGESLALLSQQPLWKLTGGMLGAAFVFGTVFLAPRIGLLNMVVLVIAGQLIMSMAIDNFGLVQVAVRKVSAIRMAGALVVVAGVALTLFGDRIVAALGR
jgi:transporter family-2 protein